MDRIRKTRKFLGISLALAAALAVGAATALFGVCGPFSDVSDAGFCPFVIEVFYLGITTGTSPTTYDPARAVSRLQMAAFLSRSADQVLKRAGRRAALNRYWTTQGSINLGLTTVGLSPLNVQSDGLDLWVANNSDGTVSRVRGGDGRLLETWTGATGAHGVLTAMGKIFVTAQMTPGRLYQIDPALAAGAVTTVASPLGNQTTGIAFDGARIWTASVTSTISIVTPTAALPWTVTSVSTGFIDPIGLVYDGTNIWAADVGANTLLKLDSNAAILQTVTLGSGPKSPIFDGTNIWVTNNFDASVSVVRASTGAVLATLTGNGLNTPNIAAFDGQRILVANGANNVSVWKAADLTPIGTFFTGASSGPHGACSDGINFWITLPGASKLARF